jgi:hypothetical protein
MLATLAATVDFSSFAFLEGRWCGSALGGEVRERWEAPFGDAMTGSMTVVRNGEVYFHELFTIVNGDGGFELRLKHFGADMVGWETRDEVVVFALVAARPGMVDLEGLTMMGDGERLAVLVTGERPIVFDYRRCP